MSKNNNQSNKDFDITAPQSLDFKKFCEGVKKFNKEIDEECEAGERQVRFITGKFTPDDITQGGV